MSGKSQVDQLTDAINYGAVGFGALAVLAPRLFQGIYGLKGDGNLMAMSRLWGSRTAAIGVIGLLSRGSGNYKNLLAVGSAMSVVDTLIIANAGPDVALRSRVMGAATSAAFAGAGAYCVSQS